MSHSQARRTAASSRKSWQGARKVLMRLAVGSDSRAGDSTAGGSEGWERQRQNKGSQRSGKGVPDWAAGCRASCDSSLHRKGSQP